MRFFKTNVQSFLIVIIIYSTMFFHGGFFSCVRIFLCICTFLLIALPKNHIDIDLTAISLLFLTIMSIFSSAINSVNSYIALLEILKYALLFLSYLMFFQLKDNELEKVKTAFYGSFLMLGIFGFLAWSGILDFADALTANDRRIQSFLQYANTTAFCMSACFLMSMDYYYKKKKILYALYGAFSIFILVLTRSRTAMILLAIVVLLYIFIYLLRYFRRDRRKMIMFCMGTLLLFVATVFLGKEYIFLLLRTGTFLERLITFQDAVNILARYPLFGIGAGGWQKEHFIYQSGFYAIRYIHSFYLQVALDSGLSALLLFLTLTARTTISSFKKKNDVILWVFILLIAGNMLEFHMNFGIIILLYTFCLVWLPHGKIFFTLHLPRKIWRGAVYIVIIAPLSIFWISEYQFDQGKRLMDQKNLSKAISAFDRSKRLNPLNYQALFNIAKCERDFDKALQYVLEAYQINPNDLDVVAALADFYAVREDWSTAIRFSEELFLLNPRRFAYQNNLLNAYDKAFTQGALSRQSYEEKTFTIVNEIEQLEISKNPLYKWMRAEPP